MCRAKINHGDGFSHQLPRVTFGRHFVFTTETNTSMRRITLFALLLLLFTAFASAQTPKENLEKAVEIYNADRAFQDNLTTKTLTDEQLGIVKSRVDQGILLLDKVIREGNADQLKVARYFKANFLYSYFFVLGMKGKNAEALELNKLLESDIIRYSAADFPMNYDFFGKNYSIKWENFSSTQAEYLTGTSEINYNMGKYKEAIRFARLALAHPGVSPFLKYISLNKILDADLKDRSILTETERLDVALQSIQMYDSQDEANKQVIKDNNYPTARRGAASLATANLKDNSPAMLTRCGTAAPLAAKYLESRDDAFQMFGYCYKNKYEGSDEFHLSALQLSKTFFPIGTAQARANAQTIGDAALTALIAKVSSTECEKFKQYAADYQAIGLASKGQALEKRAVSCSKDKEEAARKAEAARRKQARRASRNFNVYLGLDVIPLMTDVEKMDFGGHLDLRGKKVAHSFGFSVVNLRKDYNSSRTPWNGNRYFYTFKIFNKNNDNPGYTGLYFGYSDKTFEPLLSIQATSEDGSDNRFFNNLTAVDKQYELMWNSGMQALGRPFGVDFWFGIGASYNQLSFQEFESPDGYTFTGNDFFDNRKKLESINLKMRMGVSVGLNFGKKR